MRRLLMAITAALLIACSAPPAAKPSPSPTAPSGPRVATAMVLALGPELVVEFWCYTDGTVWATRIVDGKPAGDPQELPDEVGFCEVMGPR